MSCRGVVIVGQDYAYVERAMVQPLKNAFRSGSPDLLVTYWVCLEVAKSFIEQNTCSLVIVDPDMQSMEGMPQFLEWLSGLEIPSFLPTNEQVFEGDYVQVVQGMLAGSK